MISTTAFFVILVLSSTFADQAKVDQLMNQISGKIVGEMVEVARAGKGTNSVILNMRLMSTMMSALKRMGPEIKEMEKLSNGSKDIAKELSAKIIKDLQVALPDGGDRNAPRFVGALVLGITQIVTDVVKMILTRY